MQKSYLLAYLLCVGLPVRLERHVLGCDVAGVAQRPGQYRGGLLLGGLEEVAALCARGEQSGHAHQGIQVPDMARHRATQRYQEIAERTWKVPLLAAAATCQLEELRLRHATLDNLLKLHVKKGVDGKRSSSCGTCGDLVRAAAQLRKGTLRLLPSQHLPELEMPDVGPRTPGSWRERSCCAQRSQLAAAGHWRNWSSCGCWALTRALQPCDLVGHLGPAPTLPLG